MVFYLRCNFCPFRNTNFVIDMKERKLNIQINFNNFDEKVTDSFKEIANHVGNLFEYYLPKVSIIRVKKILVEFTNEPNDFFIIPENLDADVVTIRTTFDFEKFDKIELVEKEGFVLQNLVDNLQIVFKKLKLNTNGLKFARDEIIEREFELIVELCGGEKLNRNKSITAKVIAEFFIGFMLISVNFYQKNNGLIRKVELFKTWPNRIFYQLFMKTAGWRDNEVFEVASSTKEITFQINIDGTVTTLYEPKDREVDGIREEIITLTKELFIKI